jgi:uncharacterized protein YjlB
MYAKETLKRTFERVTGLGRPSRRESRSNVRLRKPQAVRFKDDGSIPNNPKLPFVHYRGAVALGDAADPAAVFEALFEGHGWGGSWRNGIYDYVHYHPRSHEVLGIARGRARVRFGGSKGKVVQLKPGDVAILPAGTGHEALSASKDLLVVGAYPPHGQYDEYQGSAKEHDRATAMIPKVALPRKDPVYGTSGPLLGLWRKRQKRR